MSPRLPELVGRVMIDPAFLEDLQRAAEPILAEYELSEDDRSTVLSALARLGQSSANQRVTTFRSELIRRVAT